MDEVLLRKNWEESIDKLNEILTSEKQEGFQSQLETFDMYREKQRIALQKEFAKTSEQCKKAFTIILALTQGSKRDAILKDFQIGQERLLKDIETNQLAKKLEEEKTFQEILGYSDATIENSYQVGLVCYEKGNYEDAIAVFSFLGLVNPFFSNVWICLGLCHQAQHHYEQAIQNFLIAQTLNSEDPIPHVYLAECCVQLHDNKHAAEHLEQVIQLAEHHKDPAYHELAVSAKESKKQLLQRH